MRVRRRAGSRTYGASIASGWRQGDENRDAHPGAYDALRSEVHDGRVLCPDCGARIAASEETFFAVQGVKPGDEFVLRCTQCGLAMTWWLAERG